MIQISSKAQRIFAVFVVPISVHFDRSLVNPDDFRSILQRPLPRSFSFQNSPPSGASHDIQMPSTRTEHLDLHPSRSVTMDTCSASAKSGLPTAIVKDLYIKMLGSIEAEIMPPNAWLWLLTENCQNREDIMLLFQILQELQRFRLSKLRIFANFSCNLCARVAERCACIGAVDFGLRTLWRNNVYGLTPSIGAAHHLLSYAKKHNDSEIMVKILKFLEKSSLPLEPRTVELVFSICYKTDKWHLISKYSRKFIKNGVQLHQIAFNIWMKFAAKIGDAKSIWRIERLRSNSFKQHSLETGFSCAKGHLLERKPVNAANIVYLLYQTLPDKKRLEIGAELQSLGNKWISDVINRQKEEDRKELAKSLTRDISTMINLLSSMGLEDLVSSKDIPR